MSKLKKLRISKNLTQVQLAEMLNVERTTISMWETGSAVPRADKLIALAQIFECTIDELLRKE